MTEDQVVECDNCGFPGATLEHIGDYGSAGTAERFHEHCTFCGYDDIVEVNYIRDFIAGRVTVSLREARHTPRRFIARIVDDRP